MDRVHNNLVIFGSPSPDSFTARLLAEVLKDFPGNTVTFNCFTAAPYFCDGCGFCKAHANCRHSDLDAFFAQFAAADRVIFAFPVYNNSFPAPLKSLIDRFQRFYNARFFKNETKPIAGEREVTVVLTMGGERDVSHLILEQLCPVFTVTGCRLKRCVALTGTDRMDPGQALRPVITEYNIGEEL